MKHTIGIISLGCPRNMVDSEHLLGRMTVRGYRVTDFEKAEIGIVNTCAFVQDAKKESIEAIIDCIDLKRAGKLRKVIVCGCLVQRYGRELRNEFPEVDAFIGSPGIGNNPYRYGLTPVSHAYLKISEGCVNNCSFCAVPLIKKRLESLEEKQVLVRLGEFDRKKITEINVIGQDITGYGLDTGKAGGLVRILSAMVRRSKLKRRWFRLLYLHPARVTDELLSLMGDDDRICRYIDLPLQHINDRILAAMNRHITRSRIERLIGRVRRILPGAAIRTAFIVGFPGETEKDFNELYRFIAETRFERLGVFLYSREEGTKAFSYPGQVAEKVKQERFDRIMRLQQQISAEHNAALMGRGVEVLIDGKEDGRYLGRTRADAPEVDGGVFVSSRRPLRTGEIVRARVTDTLEYDICAEVEDEHRQ